jgi:hypothetical protein
MLTSLTTLPKIRVWRGQLRNVNKLRASLEIDGLENVKIKEEANLPAKECVPPAWVQLWASVDERCSSQFGRVLLILLVIFYYFPRFFEFFVLCLLTFHWGRFFIKIFR